MRLVPCDRCARHVREPETVCPFCAHPRAVASPRRATAAAALAASALLTVACGGSAAPSGEGSTNGARSEESVGEETETETETERTDTNEPPPRGPDGPGVVAAYGGPSPESPRPPPPDDER